MTDSEKIYYEFLRLINEFSMSSNNGAEHAIIMQLISHADDQRPISIEELSDECYVSQATISRFVRRLGFSSYNDFKINFYRAMEIGRIRRNENFLNRDPMDMIQDVGQRAVENLQATMRDLDTEKLNRIIQIMTTHDTVFHGTPDMLTPFSRLSKDMIANGYPCFLFYDGMLREAKLSASTSNTCAVYVVLSNDYLVIYESSMMRVKEMGGTVILLTQDEIQDHSLIDLTYRYGISDSYRSGAYSVEYIARVMSCLLPRKR